MAFQWREGLQLNSELSRQGQRQIILESIAQAKSGHPGGSLSLVEILSTIFADHYVGNPVELTNPERDRMVLSKGHGVPALYAVLSAMGAFDPKELKQLRRLGHFLQGHPDRLRYPVMEASTGSLGQGVSVALGIALGNRLSFESKKIKRLPRVYAVLGDGEFQEGQVWEALMAAGKYQPGNLCFILDYNKGQIDGHVSEVMGIEPIADKVSAFGWDVKKVDGHQVEALDSLFRNWSVKSRAKPLFVIAETIKGKGVSFMEDQIKWHGVAPKPDELKQALDEIFSGADRPFGLLLSDQRGAG